MRLIIELDEKYADAACDRGLPDVMVTILCLVAQDVETRSHDLTDLSFIRRTVFEQVDGFPTFAKQQQVIGSYWLDPRPTHQVVVHLDHDPRNNHPDNLMIVDEDANFRKEI
jgi:hypothetical protein